MKTCPECKTDYKDYSLTRCPADGAELVSTDPSPKNAATDGGKSAPNYQNLVLIGAALVVMLGAFWWFSQRSANTPSPAKPAVNPTTSTNSTGSTAATNPVPDVKPPTMTDVPVGGAKTPSEAYRMLFAAVKSQDPSKIRSMLSKGSMGLAEMASGQQKKPVEEVIKNGFTETTFVDEYPQMRDERVKGNFGAVEVWNASRKQWDDIPFILEDGSWKAAFGDAFGGKWQSPGKGQAIIEQENANANTPNAMIKVNPAADANTNSNFSSGGKVTKPKNQ